MLKPYQTWNEISIDGSEWKILYDGPVYAYTMIEESDAHTTTIAEGLDFSSSFEWIKNHPNIYGLWITESWIKHLPIIHTNIDHPNLISKEKSYKTFKSMSIRTCYRECTCMSLSRIMDMFASDIVIQYLKERGVATCPVIDEK